MMVRSVRQATRMALLAGSAVATVAAYSYAASEVFLWGAELTNRLVNPTTGLWTHLPSPVWRGLQWWHYVYAAATSNWPTPVVLKATKWLGIGAVAGGMVALPFFAIGGLAVGRRTKRKLHGSARWATSAETQEGGLRATSGGILVARDAEGYLSFGGRSAGQPTKIENGGQESLVVYAPPRSGKTSGVAIPNALAFDGSIVAVDIKGEIYDATAGIRAQARQTVIRFDPLSETGSTHRWNPLETVRRGTVDCPQDLDRIAHMLFPDPPSAGNGSASFFAKTARGAFSAVGLLTAESPEVPFTLAEIARVFTRPDLRSHIETRLVARRAAGRPHTRACAEACHAFVSAPPETFQNIVSTINADLGLFLRPRIAAATSSSDFDLRDLRRSLHAIYLVTRDDDLDTLRPLTALFFQQLIGALTQRLPASAQGGDPAERHQVLLILDEFVRLGRMPRLAAANNFVAGYDLRLLIVLQDRRSPEEHYGVNGAKVLINSCGLEVVMRTRDHDMAKLLSERLGTDTVDQQSVSTSTAPGQILPRKSLTTSDQAQHLLRPEEIVQLDSTLR